MGNQVESLRTTQIYTILSSLAMQWSLKLPEQVIEFFAEILGN